MNRRAWTLAPLVAAAAFAASCADHPTAPRNASTLDAQSTAPDATAKTDNNRAALLTNIPVTGRLSDGGTFTGTFTATRFDIDEATRQVSITGTLVGTATTATGQTVAISQTVNAPVEMSRHKGKGLVFQPTSMAVCDILFLDLGPLALNLLGLTLDLSQIILDVNAVSGAGALLGNLLCAVVGLLDGFGLLAAVTQLLEAVNALLAGLSPGGATGAGLITPSPYAPGPAVMASA